MEKKTVKKLIAAIAGVVIAIIIGTLTPPEGLEPAAMAYMGIFICMIIYMMYDVAPGHITLLMTVAALIVFNVAPAKTAIGTFGNSTIWFAACVFGFAAAITKCGLLPRIAFSILKMFPQSYFGQILAMTLTSTIISPLIPSGQAKVGILGPVVTSICKEFGYEQGSRSAAGLFNSMFVPACIAGGAFMTGGMGYAILSGFLGVQMSFLGWLSATWLWFVLVVILSFLFILWYYRPRGEVAAGKVEGTGESENIAALKLKELGPMKKEEKFGALVLALALVMWITEPFHGISNFVVAVGAISAVSIYGLLTAGEFGSRIPWPTIVIMGGIFLLSDLISTLGISTWLAGVLTPIAGPLMTNPVLLITALCMITYALRYVIVSITAIVAIMFALFSPLCAVSGMNIFVVVYVTYSAAMVWNLPFNSAAYLAAEAACGGLFRHKDVVVMNYAYYVIHLLASLASIPLWKGIGMM